MTNRMMKAGGGHFRALLFEVMQTLWDHEAQPKAWNMSLLMPIHKGGGKDRADPSQLPRNLSQQRPSKTVRGHPDLSTDEVQRSSLHPHAEPTGHSARPADPRRHLLPLVYDHLQLPEDEAPDVRRLSRLLHGVPVRAPRKTPGLPLRPRHCRKNVDAPPCPFPVSTY